MEHFLPSQHVGGARGRGSLQVRARVVGEPKEEDGARGVRAFGLSALCQGHPEWAVLTQDTTLKRHQTISSGVPQPPLLPVPPSLFEGGDSCDSVCLLFYLLPSPRSPIKSPLNFN